MKRFSFGAGWMWALLSLAVPTLAPAQSAAQNSDEKNRIVTFCAYNLRNYLKMPRSVNGLMNEVAPKPEKEVTALMEFLATIQPDILGVCEIGDADDLADLQARLKARDIDLPHSEMGHGGDPTRRLGLLSRYPITFRNSQSELKYRIGDVILPMQRGILDATVALRPNFEVRFLGVHFKSQREVPGMDQKLMRRNEAHLLRRHIESVLTAEPATRLLAYGDFNENKHEAALVEIEGVPGTDVSMMDVRLRDSRGETWTHFWDAADHYSRLDYCFVNRALQSDIKKPESFVYDPPNYYDASDHRPLVIKIDRGAATSRARNKAKATPRDAKEPR